MTYEEKLAIAKDAYKEIKAVIDKWISIEGIYICWEEYIQVDDEIFHARQMREE